ncbi:hypothetical protein CJ483_05520 [Bacillus sp. PK3_68]|nr:hypothetical protein CJ483_05520 [Bacillus sp. PK3_68]
MDLQPAVLAEESAARDEDRLPRFSSTAVWLLKMTSAMLEFVHLSLLEDKHHPGKLNAKRPEQLKRVFSKKSQRNPASSTHVKTQVEAEFQREPPVLSFPCLSHVRVLVHPLR